MSVINPVAVRPAQLRRAGRRERRSPAGGFDALTRRQALAAGGCVSAASLVGCGAAPRSATESQRSVDTDRGAVGVPFDPQRVVVTDIYLISMLYDLGVKPVGIPAGITDSGALPPEVVTWLGDDVVEVGAPGELNREAVLALDADLVVDQFYPDSTRALADVTPVAFFDWRKTGRTWRSQELKVADCLNRASQLQEQADSYAERIAGLVADHARAWKLNWAFVAGSADGSWILGSVAVELLKDLKAGMIDKLTTGYVTYSREALGSTLAGADVICYPVLFTEQPPAPTAGLIKSRQFAALPAAKSGRTFPMAYSGISGYSHAARALDELEAIAEQL